eukprot:9585576-Lingulodinium_polyedra.AAC.1
MRRWTSSWQDSLAPHFLAAGGGASRQAISGCTLACSHSSPLPPTCATTSCPQMRDPRERGGHHQEGCYSSECTGPLLRAAPIITGFFGNRIVARFPHHAKSFAPCPPWRLPVTAVLSLPGFPPQVPIVTRAPVFHLSCHG